MKIERFGPGEHFPAGSGHALPEKLGDGTPASYVLMTPVSDFSFVCFGSKGVQLEDNPILIKQATVFRVSAYTHFACSWPVNIVPVEC